MKQPYMKDDLVEFCRWHSNAPVSLIRNQTAETLVRFIQKGGAWETFLRELPQIIEMRQMKKICAKAGY